MNSSTYQEYMEKTWLKHEQMCKRCGACCGTRDKDQCIHLESDEKGLFFCNIYDERFGLRKTINGNEMKCVDIRNILHKTWQGRAECAYVKYSSP